MKTIAMFFSIGSATSGRFAEFRLFLVIFIISFTIKPEAFSQLPQGLNYQSVVTDNNGAVLSGKTVQVKFDILSDTIAPTIVWEELNSTTTTNAGVINLVIGKGTRLQGVNSFADINWAGVPLYLRIKLFYNGQWKTLGTTGLWSVPYSMTAGALSNPLPKLGVEGTTDSPDSALFEVRNKSGQTVFAVYSGAVRVNVDDGLTKGVKGGFAIGGFDKSKAAPQDYFLVTSDSIRAYIAYDTTKSVKGGFAVGGYGSSKTGDEVYMRLTRDSARFNLAEPSGSGTGGFVVTSLSAATTTSGAYVNLSRDNYFIGLEAGSGITTGKYNAAYGYQAGKMNADGNSNVYIGWLAGSGNISGSGNTFIGKNAGSSNNGSGNVFIGNQAGSNETGSDKLYIGNTDTKPPLMYGDFSSGKMAINGTDAQGYTLYIYGSGYSTLPFTSASDIRLKENIHTIPDALSKVLKLRGVNFTWKDKTLAGDKEQMGLIAQEAENVIPEVVESGSTTMAIEYAPITAILIEAIKEQQKVIEEQRARIEKLEKLQSRVEYLESLVNTNYPVK